eukprot:7120229-Prymnesium_polylepis.1
MERLVAAGKLCDFASEGNLDRIEELLDCGLDASIADYDGRNPLHLAAANGHLHVIKHLIWRGADVNSKDRFGYMPVDDGERSSMPHVVEFLRRAMEVSVLKPGSKPSLLKGPPAPALLKGPESPELLRGPVTLDAGSASTSAATPGPSAAEVVDVTEAQAPAALGSGTPEMSSFQDC